MAHAWLERQFELSKRGTTVRTEILGGATTFVTMAYIIIVNPAILSFAGIPAGPSTVATILAATFGSLLMGLYANRPIAVAPYMGENAFIALKNLDGNHVKTEKNYLDLANAVKADIQNFTSKIPLNAA